MAKLTRVTAKIFGETATATGDDPQIGQFGSGLAGTYVGTTDVSTIQNLSAWSNGFIDSVTPDEQFPPLPEMTGFGKVLSYQNAYLLQQGIAEWDSATTYYENGFCSKNGKIYVSLSDNNLNNDPESDIINWQMFTSGNSRNIGEVITSTIPLVDAGLHLLDGSLLSYGSYKAFIDYIADLYDSGDYTAIFDTEANWQSAVTSYGVCGKFVYDSVNNTVRLPKITGFIEGAGSTSTVGNLVQAGLPNITGGFHSGGGALSNASGAFTLASSAESTGNHTGNVNYVSSINFNASKSSSIYGNSSTVQPQAVKVLYYIVIATLTKTDIEVDIDEIATDLNGKADVDLTNLNNTGKIANVHNVMPSNTIYKDLTVGASGSTYTATSDGYIFFNGSSTNSSDFAFVANNSNNMQVQARGGTNGYLRCFLPVQKGTVVTINYSSGVTINRIRFIYAVGSESEA